jgi:hypothetical protein
MDWCLKRKEDFTMVDRKIKRNVRELKSLRYRAHPRLYDRKVVERKNRLRKRLRHLEAVGPGVAA